MKKTIFILIIIFFSNYLFSQDTNELVIPTGISALSFVSADADKKDLAKEISEFRSKEFIVNFIIGPANSKEIKFETEALASDNGTGIISVAFNCNDINERGLLLAFFGNNKDANGYVGSAYAFRYIPLSKAKDMLDRIDMVMESHKKYISADINVNNVYIEFEDIRFIIYKDGGEKIRVFWNGFEMIWEKTSFDKTKKKLEKWFS
ncbi:MAG: hypothetical protein DRI86_14320 [Bacteroidetes bacterium]|nr:MAG: hypothetical protein DRI86_14320 [Bacteroidota bacterium]